MKVKILLNNIESGGIETALVNFVNNMKDLVDLEVLLFRETGREHLLNCKVDFVDRGENSTLIEMQKSHLKQKKLSLKSKLKWLYFKILNRLNLSSKYLAKKYNKKCVADVGICFAPWDNMTQFYKYAFDCKVNICVIHNDASKFKLSNDAYKNMSHFDYICCVSKSCADAFIKTFPLLKDKVDYLYNMQDNDAILNKSQDNPLTYDKNVINIISVLRVCQIKGFDIMPEVLIKLKSDGFKFCWHVIGDGDLKPSFEKFVAENNLQEEVKMYGEQNNPFKFIKNADLFLLPSHHEAAPMVYAESMLLQVPVLTTDTCSAHELVGKKGFVCGQTAEEIYLAIKNLLENPQLIDEKRKGLKNYTYDNQQIIDKFFELVEKKR